MGSGYASPRIIHSRMACLERAIVSNALALWASDPAAVDEWRRGHLASIAVELAELRRVHAALQAEAERLGVHLIDLGHQQNSIGLIDLPRGTARCPLCSCPCGPSL